MFISKLKLTYALAFFIAMSGLAINGCVTAQQQRTADIGPGTFPSGLPQSTPSADRAPDNPTGKNAARSAMPGPSSTPVPPATQQNTFGL